MKTTSYWATQFIVLGFFGVALPVLGWFFLGSEEPGRGLILIIIGLFFLGFLLRMIRNYRRMSKTQRDIYAWAITQQHAAGVGDTITMEVAGRAQAGALRPDELQWLIDLNRDNPYPGDTRATQTGV